MLEKIGKWMLIGLLMAGMLQVKFVWADDTDSANGSEMGSADTATGDDD